MTELELELRDLAAHLDLPPAPPLSGAVLDRLVRHRRRQRVLVVALAAGVAALAVALAVPSSRAALLRLGASLTARMPWSVQFSDKVNVGMRSSCG